MVKLKLAISIAAVCLNSSTVLVTVIIVVEYRFVYQLMVGGYLVRAIKALVVSKPIAIFHTGDRKS